MTLGCADPPRVARRLLRALLPADEHDYVVGDIDEEYHSVRLPLLGQRSARRWYWGQALRSVISVRRGSGRTDLKGQHMLAALTEALDDLRYGFRNLVGAPAFALLTIGTLGLAIGVNSAIFSMIDLPHVFGPLVNSLNRC